MDFSNFLCIEQELKLIALLVILFLYDTFCSKEWKKYFQNIAIVGFAIVIISEFPPYFTMYGEAFGGIHISSQLTFFMKSILNVATFLVFLQANKWLSSEKMLLRQGEFYVIMLISLLGMYFMISAENFVMLYIGMETASLPLACLVAFDKYQEKSAEAAVKYILTSALSSGVMLFGLSFLYGSLGSFYYSDIALNIVSSPLVKLGFVFFFGGLGFKLSLVPFHLWTADVYEGAPTSVTAYLSVVSKGAATFALIFVLYKVFGRIELIWNNILCWLLLATIVLGNLFAIRQQNIKRFFAFSSISQAGYILLGIIAGTAQGMTSTIFYTLVYLFSNLAAFGVIASVEYQTNGDTRIVSFNGLYRSNPGLAFVMMLAVFSLGGIPPFAGFFSKFFIFMAAAEQKQYILVFIALLNTVMSLYYYLLIVKAMFIEKRGEVVLEKIGIDNYNRISMVICTIGIFVIGFLSAIYEYIETISFGVLQK
ncbi:NADH-quinone oxidoreductase subunit N [Candidatus Azobacteroides pseudotrichonymphae]|uniref:NADH-quinone oxidoreductase subunit N n=1 Tax=Azobacteroides pseudotrichonymphae genomovar. CFP2 TaxID=511995 RepID=NUON_AZOPC|nr:NADH-quinone oxidoreductase subunit N [Candidatus Azobacteroides pseudotrichonymphae]B6YQ48.1 RecName: Full=NADH-quinone oxidoreductase subunit N; AltName: Full=NADH dehydrogenase I subunit N; AltName: Full=NDH-1 subunit N [Candidatus Azobacteroides pseudotrichonymphae genomovar. CFP2]BAG83320.1 NADH dehydrogenase I subunit N [Candidatus Azobacteroides pseudotrichonymphae genomovar. CFP2]